ncbi:MAG: hypothetical protein AABY18_02655 [Candidatus Thermoplasmatota archaeon]
MIRLTVALVGLAVFGAIFALIYYDPDNELKVDSAPAFQLAPGEARQTTLQPTIAGTPIAIEVHATGGAFDLYVMEKEWSDSLADNGRLSLQQPFSYYAEHSRIGVDGEAVFALLSDGVTEYLLVFDNSDNHYSNDTVPDLTGPTQGAVSVQITIRYLEEESRSLVLGYIAATPSVLLVIVTVGRKVRRLVKERKAP